MPHRHTSLCVICGIAFFGDDFIVQTGEHTLDMNRKYDVYGDGNHQRLVLRRMAYVLSEHAKTVHSSGWYPSFKEINNVYARNAALPCSDDYQDAIDVATILMFYADTDDQNVTSRPYIGSISILVSVLGGVVDFIPVDENKDTVVARLIQLLS